MRSCRIIAIWMALVIVSGCSVVGAAQSPLEDSGQRLGFSASWQAVSGDIDGDGDLDVLVANLDRSSTLWLNDGTGQFTESPQRLASGAFVALADLDCDGALDILTASWDQPLRVWWNDGAAGFSEADVSLSPSGVFSIATGDLNGDGLLDIFVGRINEDHALLNQGERSFVDPGDRYTGSPTGGVVIEDMDGDEDLDVVTAGWDEPGRVWANDGSGALRLHSEFDAVRLHVHHAIAADYEGDGDLDLFFALAGGWCCGNLWLNDGQGVFSVLDLNLGSQTTQAIGVEDLDLDGDWDLIQAVGTSVHSSSALLWLGVDGGFVLSDGEMGFAYGGGVATGDFDDDGDVDLFLSFSTYSGSAYRGHPNEVWMNTAIQDEASN